jgi:hypothetical protein
VRQQTNYGSDNVAQQAKPAKGMFFHSFPLFSYLLDPEKIRAPFLVGCVKYQILQQEATWWEERLYEQTKFTGITHAISILY